MREKPWAWLSEPLVLDFCNTVHWHGTDEVDHIDTVAGVQDWIGHEPHPLPAPGDLGGGELVQLLALRDATRRTLRRLAAGEKPDDECLDIINATARRHPTTRCIDPSTLTENFEPTTEQTNPLIGHLSAATVTLLVDRSEAGRLGFCTAPNCGGLFRQSRPDQRWCHPDCGARARAHRQYQRGRRA